MANAALENGVLEFVFEAAARADAALGGEGAAEHGTSIRQSRAAETALNQFLNRQHAIQRAFLVQHARAVDPCERTQNHLIPMINYVVEFPQHRRHWLIAHLFGHRDAIGLNLAVGVIGTKADKEAA